MSIQDKNQHYTIHTVTTKKKRSTPYIEGILRSMKLKYLRINDQRSITNRRLIKAYCSQLQIQLHLEHQLMYHLY